MAKIPPIRLTRAGKGITFCRTRKREGRMTVSAPDLRRSNRLRWRRYANSDRTRLWIGRTSGYVQRKAGAFSGSQPHQGKSQNLVAGIVGRKETESRESIDKAIFRMVSESAGRNESERTGGLENVHTRGRALLDGAKAA
jgi:hypothetical protein